MGARVNPDRILIVHPEERFVTADELILLAKADITNGDSVIADDPADITNLEDALAVLADSGSVTISPRQEAFA